MLYTVLEKAINGVLQWDPDTLNRLGTLRGKVVKISLTDWQMDCYILLQEQGVRLTGQYTGLADTIIRGKLSGLIQVGRSGAAGVALFDHGVEVSGDAELGEKIRDILRKVDLDGEECLSKLVGDTAAHAISWRAKRALEIGKRAWRGLAENVREYCQIEAGYLPNRAQVETFYRQIAHLRDDVDRAAARIERIKSRRSNNQ